MTAGIKKNTRLNKLHGTLSKDGDFCGVASLVHLFQKRELAYYYEINIYILLCLYFSNTPLLSVRYKYNILTIVG
jgi:hypothetical protein